MSITADKIRQSKGENKIVMLTAYDATFASIFDHTKKVDILLVGDSLGMVIQGHKNTLPVTLDHAIYHTAAVSRVTTTAQVLGDLPFMTYSTPEKAVESAGRLVQEGGAHAVKLEGGSEVVPQVEKIIEAGIPVCGHIGLTPQSVHRMGGFKVQGKSNKARAKLLEDARSLSQTGCYALVLEGIPSQLAEEITKYISIPTIGIGAGPGCDGQVLVCYDLLGLNPDFKPKFVKQYDNLYGRIFGAVQKFSNEVSNGEFPDEAHSFK